MICPSGKNQKITALSYFSALITALQFILYCQVDLIKSRCVGGINSSIFLKLYKL
jgi:hypothetical protein